MSDTGEYDSPDSVSSADNDMDLRTVGAVTLEWGVHLFAGAGPGPSSTVFRHRRSTVSLNGPPLVHFPYPQPHCIIVICFQAVNEARRYDC